MYKYLTYTINYVRMLYFTNLVPLILLVVEFVNNKEI